MLDVDVHELLLLLSENEGSLVVAMPMEASLLL
jgi:hypothetical protein